MAKQDMLINSVHGEECRIAIVTDGHLEELYTERSSADLHVSNIYRGRVTNVESSIQAAFVDFGEARSGFLHITDLHPRYFPGEAAETTERVGYKTPRRERPPIQQCLRRGQEILVQVLKEGLGTKGPTITSYLSIPGRYLVMMPHMERHGVSRKIEDAEQRREMREILDELDPPEELGFIVRTAGFGRPKTELKRDLNYLLRLWKDIKTRMARGRGPAKLYTESDLVIRTLRDVLTPEIKRIVADDRVAALRARDFLRVYMPRSSTKVFHYPGPAPLFDAFGVERQIQLIHQRQVPLDSGGSLVFDQTEALVAIDVNSGKFRDKSDAESTAYRTNQEAVDEIARQLRLRDLGGLLVLDLIDMYKMNHRRDIERRFRENLRKDRARTKVLKISDLGMLEMTRQRMRPSLKKSVYNECVACGGTGQLLSGESVVLAVMRRLAGLLSHDKAARVEVRATANTLAELMNRKRAAMVELERASGKIIEFRCDPALGPDQVEIDCFTAQGVRVDVGSLPAPGRPKLTDEQEITTADLKELDQLEQFDVAGAVDEAEQREAAAEAEEGAGKKKRRRRRKRRAKKTAEQAGEVPAEQPKEAAERAEEPAPPAEPEPQAAAPRPATEGEPEAEAREGEPGGEDEDQPKRRRRRRGGRRRRKTKPEGEAEPTTGEEQPEPAEVKAQPEPAASSAQAGGYVGQHQHAPDAPETPQAPVTPETASTQPADQPGDGDAPAKAPPRKKRPRRRTTRSRRSTTADADKNAADNQAEPTPSAASQ